MTEQEYQLIAGLFDNLRRMNGQPKDGQADAAIRQQAAQTPDAAYWLAQRSLLLEQSLQQAQAQIAQLQAQLQEQASAAALLRASQAEVEQLHTQLQALQQELAEQPVAELSAEELAEQQRQSQLAEQLMLKLDQALTKDARLI